MSFVFAEERPEERRLAGAIWADETDDLPALQHDVEIVDQHAVSDADAACSAMTTWSPPRSPALSRSAIVPSQPIGRAQSRQSFERFAASLRLPRVLPREVAADVVLLIRDELLLLVEGRC